MSVYQGQPRFRIPRTLTADATCIHSLSPDMPIATLEIRWLYLAVEYYRTSIAWCTIPLQLLPHLIFFFL